MDASLQRALTALEPYVLLAPSATSARAACDLIKQATSHPGTYVFAELLATPAIQALRSAPPEAQQYLHLLEIFSWGVWKDWEGATSSLPALSSDQARKLRLLTLLTLVSSSPPTLAYAPLLEALSLTSRAELESLATSAIYESLLCGTLNPLAARLDVVSVAPLRDPRPGSVPTLLRVLRTWNARCESVLTEVDAEVESVRAAAGRRALDERRHAAAVDAAVEEEAGRKGKRGVEGEGEGGLGGKGERSGKRGGRFGGWRGG